MPTDKQELGKRGEELVTHHCACPRCKRQGTLKRLIQNFKCTDVICDFCGYLAQVKASTVSNIEKIPKTLLGAAWGPQEARMKAGIYFPLFIVLVSGKDYAIYYLPADLQTPEMFLPRNKLSATARRAGWQGFYYNLSAVPAGATVQLYTTKSWPPT